MVENYHYLCSVLSLLTASKDTKNGCDLQMFNNQNNWFMATKKVYDACCQCIRQMNLQQVTSAGCRKITKPAMSFLFEKTELVTEKELMRCGEIEQRRHLNEDAILRSIYIELYSKVKPFVKHSNMVGHT